MTGRKHGHSFNGSRKGKNTMSKSTDAFYTVINGLVIPVEIIAKSAVAPTLTVLVTEDTWPWKKGEKLHVNTYDVKKFDEFVETRSEDEIREQLWEDNDSAEKEEEHKNWYRERAENFEFHPFTLACDMCIKRDAFYIGVTVHGTPFGFCKYCRDEMVQLKIQRTQSEERFGV
jgi:hypothetical protein